MTDLTLQVEELGKSSRRSAAISAIGLTILVGSLLATGWRLSSAEVQVTQAQTTVDKLHTEQVTLEGEKRELESDIAELNRKQAELKRKNQGLQEEVDRLRGPIKSLVEIDSAVQKLGVPDPKGRPLYDFSLWVNLPDFRKREVTKVHYHFDHPDVILKDRYADNPANGFSISYRGWGCFHRIHVTLTTVDGEKVEKEFDQCAKLEW